MSDSVDRVFAHALQTVRKIPRTGSARPPPDARLKLYGLYKQAMEGDVEGVMDQPNDKPEIDKWQAWYAQRGLSKTEAKRRYIEALIETMHRYASSTVEARELVSELEFVWDQIRSNVASEMSSPPERLGVAEEAGAEAGLGQVSPAPYGDEVLPSGEDTGPERSPQWRARVEKALAKMTTEVAALREQLEVRRAAARRGGQANVWLWVVWVAWAVVRHLLVEAAFWGLVFLWMRRRGDKRAEEALRIVMRWVKEAIKDLGFGRRRKAAG